LIIPSEWCAKCERDLFTCTSEIRYLVSFDEKQYSTQTNKIIIYLFRYRTEWLEQFEERNLIALSASPLLIYPIRYTSDDGYVSDTEDSVIVQVTNDKLATEQNEIKEDL
jgi:hypothetical protein